MAKLPKDKGNISIPGPGRKQMMEVPAIKSLGEMKEGVMSGGKKCGEVKITNQDFEREIADIKEKEKFWRRLAKEGRDTFSARYYTDSIYAAWDKADKKEV